MSCDFNSHVYLRKIDETRFAAALRREMRTVRAGTGSRSVTSIFIGGGTPSLMASQTVAVLLDTNMWRENCNCLSLGLQLHCIALTEEITRTRGIPGYEISNHAIPRAQSQHNLLYWRYQPYAGFGPGAHGRFLKIITDRL